MRTSMKHIADTLKLSKTTVSWVLSGQGDEKRISEETQQKVWDCAKRLHYEPNLLARSLNTGISSTVGLIIPDITDSFYSRIARAIESEAEKQGYSLMICSSESNVEREDRMIRLFKAKQVDGIILAPTRLSEIEVQALQAEQYPLVLFDRYFPHLHTNFIIIDNEGSSYELVSRMIAKGASKIAIITTNSYLHTMSLRREGYARAMADAGLDATSELYGEVKFANYEVEINGILDKIFETVPAVDGFFFTTHILALEAFRYFSEHGIDINKGFELGCIHSISAFRALAPNMHIAKMPVEEIGHHAVRILLKDIRAKQAGKQLINDVEQFVIPCILP